MKKSGIEKQFQNNWFGYPLFNLLRHRHKPRRSWHAGLSNIQRSDTSTDTNDEDDDIKIPTTPKTTEVVNSMKTEYTHNTLETEYTHNSIEKYSIGRKIDQNDAIDKFDNDMNKIGKSKKIPLNIEKQCEEKEVIIQQKKKYGTKQPSSRTSNEEHISDSYKKLERLSKPDDFDVFGDLVARKIRNLRTPYAQYTVQHLINNLLYEGELGKYNEPPKNKHARYPHECSTNFSFNPHFNPFQFSEHAILNQDISPNASTKLSSDYVTL